MIPSILGLSCGVFRRAFGSPQECSSLRFLCASAADLSGGSGVQNRTSAGRAHSVRRAPARDGCAQRQGGGLASRLCRTFGTALPALALAAILWVGHQQERLSEGSRSDTPDIERLLVGGFCVEFFSGAGHRRARFPGKEFFAPALLSTAKLERLLPPSGIGGAVRGLRLPPPYG